MIATSKDTSSWNQYHLDLEQNDCTLKWPDEYVIRFCKTDLARIRARRVLEMGCGSGRHAWLFRLHGFRVTASDVAESAIRITRRRLEDENLADGVELLVSDATGLPHGDNTFDGVLAWRFLHVYSPEKARACVNEIFRLLRPGGVALLGTRSPRSTNYELIQAGAKADREFDYQPGQLSDRAVRDSYFSREDLQSMFNAFGDVQIEHMEWTRNNGTFREAYWSVTAVKPLE